jgi:hypothetical protein
MSIEMLYKLNGRNSGEFKKFVDELKGIPRIAWYPSAGEDFSPLLLLNKYYSNLNPTIDVEPAPPDIFLFTDYFPLYSKDSIDKKFVYSSNGTEIILNLIEELPKIHFPLKGNSYDYYISDNGQVFFLEATVKSEILGEFKFPVIYAFTENQTFCSRILLKNKSIISHIIHHRYCSGCTPGGKTSSDWFMKYLERLKCEVYISLGFIDWRHIDNTKYQSYYNYKVKTPKMRAIRILKDNEWHGHGDVIWYLMNK